MNDNNNNSIQQLTSAELEKAKLMSEAFLNNSEKENSNLNEIPKRNPVPIFDITPEKTLIAQEEAARLFKEHQLKKEEKKSNWNKQLTIAGIATIVSFAILLNSHVKTVLYKFFTFASPL